MIQFEETNIMITFVNQKKKKRELIKKISPMICVLGWVLIPRYQKI